MESARWKVTKCRVQSDVQSSKKRKTREKCQISTLECRTATRVCGADQLDVRHSDLDWSVCAPIWRMGGASTSTAPGRFFSVQKTAKPQGPSVLQEGTRSQDRARAALSLTILGSEGSLGMHQQSLSEDVDIAQQRSRRTMCPL